MPPAAFIEHKLARRVRLKIPSKRGDQEFFEDLVRRLSAIPGVAELSANPGTGSVVVRHDGGSDAITSAVARDGLLRIETRPEAVLRRGHRGATNADPNQALAAGLSGLSLVQAARGRITGSASENLWNAYRAHTHLENPLLTTVLLGLGLYQLASGEFLNSATALLFYAMTAQRLAQERAAAGSGETPDLTPAPRPPPSRPQSGAHGRSPDRPELSAP